ncbi:uracil phosphoribosyltransferase [Gonapodya prolifera JEL478]|uniref:uracil phosphoribosyltransferase n=1 Tax=Gonapodya prolifera (strain JEL478) TaxID=1344416 RepID=A0A139APQ3_GONPJ|nr:uracil phosphoribosyltransferase [Gonapodya prolifera JEL478]|eukprot:KXS18634.1 uracil phosphoribosyltransferase [Gonapodya prolifera JEL478]
MSLHVSRHPLVLHKLSQLRDKRQPPVVVRNLVTELTLMLVYEAVSDFQLINAGEQQTPIGPYDHVRIGTRVAVVPIMRAGTGMLEGVLGMLPGAKVHHLGIFREQATLQPVEYYNKLPQTVEVDVCIVLDPMIATAGTAVAAVNTIKDWGCKRIKFLSLCAARPGLERLQEAHPDIEIYVSQVDDNLSEDGYVMPGLGDIGDRLFNTD